MARPSITLEIHKTNFYQNTLSKGFIKRNERLVWLECLYKTAQMMVWEDVIYTQG